MKRPLVLLTLCLIAAAACSSPAKEPPIVASGPPNAVVGGAGSTTADASTDASDASSPPPAVEAGAGQIVTCTYTAAGSLGVVCAVELDVPKADVPTFTAACTAAAYDGMPGTTCSPDSLAGCCRTAPGATPSFSAPTATCYYPGDSEDATTCTSSGGVWTNGLP